MISPAQQLAEVAETFDCRITFFLELIQWERFHFIKSYKQEISQLDKLIVELYSRGHDIQIHGHSEWVTATFEKDRWIRAWSGRDHVHDILPEFLAVFDLAKERLTNLLPATYRPKCYRAGGYQVEPVKPLFAALRKRGFISDSSRHKDQFFGLLIEEGMISLPILGNFPTKSDRWDMNLSWQSPFYVFRKKKAEFDTSSKFAVMIGHSKQPHYWPAIKNTLKLIRMDDQIKSTTISEQVDLISALYKAELSGKL